MTTATEKTAEQTIRDSFERSKCHAIITFAGPGTDQPGFRMQGVDPIQILAALRSIEAGNLKIDQMVQPIPQLDGLGYLLLSGDRPRQALIRCAAVRLEGWRINGAIAALKLYAEFLMTDFFLVQKQRELEAEMRMAQIVTPPSRSILRA